MPKRVMPDKLGDVLYLYSHLRVVLSRLLMLSGATFFSLCIINYILVASSLAVRCLTRGFCAALPTCKKCFFLLLLAGVPTTTESRILTGKRSGRQRHKKYIMPFSLRPTQILLFHQKGCALFFSLLFVLRICW